MTSPLEHDVLIGFDRSNGIFTTHGGVFDDSTSLRNKEWRILTTNSGGH